MEPLSNNFTLTEKSSTSILLKFWGYFWLQDFRGSKKGSIYVCRNLPMSHLVQFKAWKWGFGWFSNLQAWKTWFFRFQGSPTRYGEFCGLQFRLQSPQNFIFINFRKNCQKWSKKVMALIFFQWKLRFHIVIETASNLNKIKIHFLLFCWIRDI